MAKKQTAPQAVVDPVGRTIDDVERRIQELSGSLLHKQPLQEWLVGLASLKARVGAQLPWDEIAARLHLASQAALQPGAKITVDGKTRAPTNAEKIALQAYLVAPKVSSSIKNYLKRMHPELWIKVRAAANGRGTGVRRDEEQGVKEARREANRRPDRRRKARQAPRRA